MSVTTTLQADSVAQSNVTCLSSDDHEEENITDPLTHYLGCLRFSSREEYKAKLENFEPEARDRIRADEDRIELIRQILAGTEDDKRLADSLVGWRNRNSKSTTVVAQNARPVAAASAAYDVDEDFNAHLIQFIDSKGQDYEGLRDDGRTPLFTGRFPNQKAPIALLLGQTTCNPFLNTENSARSTTIRYFHFPANNMKWVQDAIARYYQEPNTQYDTARRKAKDRTHANTLLSRNLWLGQEHGRGSPIIHARHLRPLCELAPSDPQNMNSKPRNIALFMPYLHWELDHQREYFSNVVDKMSAQHQKRLRKEEAAQYAERCRVHSNLTAEAGHVGPDAANGNVQGPTKTSRHPTNSSIVSAYPAPRGTAETVNELISRKHNSRFPHLNSRYPKKDKNGRLTTGSQLGQLFYDAFRMFKTMNNFRDQQLIEKYLNGNAHLHPRRTLDQAHYWTLSSTKARDRDQVVYRGTAAKRDILHHFDPTKEEGSQWSCKERRLDFSRFDEEKTMQEKRKQAQKVLLNIVQEAWQVAKRNIKGGIGQPRLLGVSEPGSATHWRRGVRGVKQKPKNTIKHEPCYECRESIQKVPRLVMVDQLWMWILDDNTIITCFPKRYGMNQQDLSGVHKTIRQRLDGMKNDCIHSAYDIALVIIDECSGLFFDRTKSDERQPQVVEAFSQAIGNMAQKHTISFNHFSHWADELAKVSSRQSSIVDLSSLHTALLNITPEIKLQRETKDIIEELGIMLHLVKKQREVLKRFIKHAGSLLKIASKMSVRKTLKRRRFTENAKEISEEADSHVEELEGLLKSAEDVGNGLEQLLALKQQQASVVQAWQAIQQGREAVSQGQAIMIFTVITIIFLPLSFMAAIFGMNNDAMKDDNMSFQLQLNLMFTISLGVIIIVVGVAFSSGVRYLSWSLFHYCGNFWLVHTGLYDLWLKLPDQWRVNNVVTWAENVVQDMKDDVRRKRRRLIAQERAEEENIREKVKEKTEMYRKQKDPHR